MKIAVLEYDTGEVIIKDVPKELQELDGDDIHSRMGFYISSSDYMIIENCSIHINIDTENCKVNMDID